MLCASLLTQYLDDFVIIYLDDILIYSDDEREHIGNVRKALNVLRKNKLYAKRSKCTFGVQETEYSGFILKGDGVAINPKTLAIESLATPQSKKDI